MCTFALSLNFFLSIEKLKVSGFVHSFEDGTKLKIPSEIAPLLKRKGPKDGFKEGGIEKKTRLVLNVAKSLVKTLN
jgi:hypothetical protein